MRTELLAPVGSKDAFYAAIYNGANAVYLGGKAFGARAYADNFTNEEIAEMIAFAHLLDVKVYVTVNIVVYDDEFSQLTEFLDFLYLHDCDAVIIQDIGVATFISHRYPNFALHASTQMNIHSIEQVKALKLLGFSRVVLAREVSLKEIVLIKEAVDIELEVFVHGALCVSCSGNCYMSSIIGKRSGNRGRCAQPCRLEYEFNKKTKYFISPKDLNTLEYVDELLDAQIDSLKIEGRMKRPEYVAQVVSSYQKAILGYYDKKEWNVKAEQDALKTIFNRGFTKGWLFDEKNEEFINEQFSNHGGIEIGEVISSTQDWIDISLTHPLHYQDAIRIVGDYEDGIVVNQMYQNHQMIKSANAGDVVTLKPHISGLMGAKVLLTTDQRQIEVLRQSYQTLKPMIAIQASLLVEDQYLVLRLVCRDKVVEVKSEKKVEIANNDQMTKRIIEQLHKTANTLFYFSNIEVLFSQGVFLPIKDINALRRNGLEKLSLVLAKK
ncbi:MAG: U32 family peptidase, partial [Bacilli bacterium]|nr:U32 family peptidase [Bacilli bacterium]